MPQRPKSAPGTLINQEPTRRKRDYCGVQDISIVTSRLPTVFRPEASRTVFLTFEGLRESRTAADKLTRVRIAMPATLIEQLRDLLDGTPAE